jgi:CDGSH-type Zn-finger protein
MCGLSSDQPFCDGSHNKTVDEEAGTDVIPMELGLKSSKDNV